MINYDFYHFTDVFIYASVNIHYIFPIYDHSEIDHNTAP